MKMEDMIDEWIDKMDGLQNKPETDSSTDKPRMKYDINWSRVKIRHENPVPVDDTIDKKPSSVLVAHTSTVDNSGGSQSLTQKFSARRTESCCEVLFHKGLDIPMRSILPLPDAVKVPMSGMELVIQETGLEAVLEEKMSWQIENTVTVSKKEIIKVTTTLEEQQWEGDFTVTTKVSGKVVIAVYENNHFKRSHIAPISNIFKHAKEVNPEKYSNIQIRNDTVQLETSGSMKFMFNVGHNTKVEKMKSDLK